MPRWEEPGPYPECRWCEHKMYLGKYKDSKRGIEGKAMFCSYKCAAAYAHYVVITNESVPEGVTDAD